MDPLTALGLAGNVLQVIEFSVNLVLEGNRIYNSADGALSENKDTAQLADDLGKLTIGLSESQSKWSQAHEGKPLDADEIRLGEICDRCRDIAEDLNAKLDKLKVQGKYRRLKSIKQALVSVWKADDLDATAAQLEKYRNEINTHILFGLRKSLQENDVRGTQQYANLDQRTKDLTDAIIDGGEKLDDRLGDQAVILAQIAAQQDKLLTIVTSHERSKSPSFDPPPQYDETENGKSSNSPLHEAAATGDIFKLRQLLRSPNHDVNAMGELGVTALHLAKTPEVAKRLLAAPRIAVDAEDDDGRSALHYAVLKRNLGVVRLLLIAGADKTLEDFDGKSASFYATDCPAALWLFKYGTDLEARAPDLLNNTGVLHMAWLGDLEGTKFFISQGANVNARNDWKETALTESARHGDLEVVEALLAAGADIQAAEGNGGWTPLLQAVRDKREDVVATLLKHGANKHAKLKSGNTALAEACKRGHFEVARLLITAGCDVNTSTAAKSTPLISAVERGASRLTRLLLESGAKIDALDSNGSTAVFLAARRGHPKTLKALLDHKANAESRDPKSGYTPLSAAARNNEIECVRTLLNHGVQVDAIGRYEHTALGEATWSGYLEVAKLLVERGATHDILDGAGYTALSNAAQNGHEEIVSLLAAAGADFQATGFGSKNKEWSLTPLMRATTAGHAGTVTRLIELGAKMDARDASGRTALHFAAVGGQTECASILIQKGAEINVQDLSGDTPLMLAAAKPYVDIVKSLMDAGANSSIRNSKFRTAWIWAVHAGEERKLKELLGPTSVATEPLLAEQHPREIAAHLNEAYS